MTGLVLVIEDDPDTRALLASRLAKLGYRVETAAHGEAGLRCAVEQRPGAAIIDVLLPGIDGWEVARRLRADARTSAIALVVTSVLDLRLVQPPVSVDALLDKPFRLADVRAVMRSLATTTTDGS